MYLVDTTMPDPTPARFIDLLDHVARKRPSVFELGPTETQDAKHLADRGMVRFLSGRAVVTDEGRKVVMERT